MLVVFLMSLIVLLYLMRQQSVFWWAQSRSHLWLAVQCEYPAVVYKGIDQLVLGAKTIFPLLWCVCECEEQQTCMVLQCQLGGEVCEHNRNHSSLSPPWWSTTSGRSRGGSMEPLFWRAAFENTMRKRTIIGASLSEPHIDSTAGRFHQRVSRLSV